MKKKSPFYKTGPLFFGPGRMADSSSDSKADADALVDEYGESGSAAREYYKSKSSSNKKDNEITSHTEENNASLGRSTRQRKIDNLKGKLKDVKAKTMSLASKSEKTGDEKEVAQKYHILGKRDQASRIEKRIARKEGRKERKAIRQSLKGKENRGERRKQIIESRQGQRKKVKSINQGISSSSSKSKVTKSKVTKSSSLNTDKKNNSQRGGPFGGSPVAKLGRAPSSQSNTVTLSAGRNKTRYSSKK